MTNFPWRLLMSSTRFSFGSDFWAAVGAKAPEEMRNLFWVVPISLAFLLAQKKFPWEDTSGSVGCGAGREKN